MNMTFWSHVAIKAPNQCWLWTAGTDHGYGKVKINGRTTRAHRYVYQETHGEVPEGMHVLHTCDTPLCCNPFHLVAGTNQDNVADRTAKGRSAKTTKPVTMNFEKATSLRQEYAAGMSIHALSKKYGISRRQVRAIRDNECWTSAPPLLPETPPNLGFSGFHPTPHPTTHINRGGGGEAERGKNGDE